MFNFKCTYLELGQQSEQDNENTQGDDDSLPVTGEVEGGNCQRSGKSCRSRKRIVITYCTQTSDTITITLSSASQTIRTDSQDLDRASTERTECQTMDGVFRSVNEYATLLKKASSSPNFREDLAKIRSHIAHLPQPKMDPVAFEKNIAGMLVARTSTNA